MKFWNVVLYIASFLCFLASLPMGDAPLIAMGAIPFWILMCTAVHESGHVLGCKLNGNAIREIRLPLLIFAEGKITVSDRLCPTSYCLFKRNGSSWLVYLLGPAFSLALWLAVLGIYLVTRHFSLLMGSILAFLVFAVNALPLGANDMAMVVREILHRNEKKS